jgi:hypothetical protein
MPIQIGRCSSEILLKHSGGSCLRKGKKQQGAQGDARAQPDHDPA